MIYIVFLLYIITATPRTYTYTHPLPLTRVRPISFQSPAGRTRYRWADRSTIAWGTGHLAGAPAQDRAGGIANSGAGAGIRAARRASRNRPRQWREDHRQSEHRARRDHAPTGHVHHARLSPLHPQEQRGQGAVRWGDGSGPSVTRAGGAGHEIGRAAGREK